MSNSVEQRLLRLEAKFAISQLPYQYAVAVDMRDPELMLSLFANTGVSFSSPILGYNEIVKYTDSLWGDLKESILFVMNHCIQYQDDKATGLVYCLAKFGQRSRWHEQAIRYDDEYVETNDGWKFLCRRHSLWYGEIQQSNPMRQAAADWPASETGRGTLPYEWPSWRHAVEGPPQK
jgi:SnoaL-like domain